ncbi:autotransporter-associated beta strand protein [Rhodoferax ferrireducens]|uniref:Autotransporter-associated beta strand protein n=1 Tax=Rhodoferax ferrireducens TaxID=192843 RepID=A0ABU2C649_9BURK|nr:phosphatase PAP2 family protein [Rhodoferax ferrireducens]MDR7376809.1 autotransporter-associated beta strand protein [Rhodoferax ferrireducens]
MSSAIRFPVLPLVLAVCSALSACGGGDSDLAVPSAPADPGFVDAAPAPTVAAFVDSYKTNLSANTTTASNAGLALLAPFSELWTTGSAWNNGAPTAKGLPVLSRNIQYVANLSASRTSAQADTAYYIDRRNQNYSVIDGLGPLAAPYYTGAGATTSITSIPANATTVAYTEAGTGGGSTSSSLGSVVSLVNLLRGNFSSTTPSKNFFQYPRPWRMTNASVVQDTGAVDSLGFPVYSSSVALVPTLLPVRSTTPATDGGFTSGHTNAAYLAAWAMAYAVPERFQEILTRASDIGDYRIVAGMHSPMDVMGGRTLATALAAAILNDSANATAKAAAVAQAHSYLQAQTGSSDDTFYSAAHSATTATDAYADRAANQASYTQRLTYGFSPINATTTAPSVPKGAEVLLETRLPYLSAEQRRVVLKTTAIASGYPLLDDAEGWGRLNLFAASEGYGVFNGNVLVAMDASKKGYHALDTWRNDIGGAGKLTKQGSGSLRLAGRNSWTGGTQIDAGTLEAASATALGKGDVYNSAGTFVGWSGGKLALNGSYTQLAGGTLQLALGTGEQGRIAVAGVAALGGALKVQIQSGYTPAVGDMLTLISCAGRTGTFASVSVDGFKVTPIYGRTGVSIRLDAKS